MAYREERGPHYVEIFETGPMEAMESRLRDMQARLDRAEQRLAALEQKEGLTNA